MFGVANVKKKFDDLDPVKRSIRKTKKERTFVRLPESIKEEMEKKAEEMDTSLNSLIIHACIEVLKKK